MWAFLSLGVEDLLFCVEGRESIWVSRQRSSEGGRGTKRRLVVGAILAGVEERRRALCVNKIGMMSVSGIGKGEKMLSLFVTLGKYDFFSQLFDNSRRVERSDCDLKKKSK